MKKEHTEERDPVLEYQAGSTLVDDGIRFKIPFLFSTKLSLTIRPLRPGTIIKISQQVTRLKPVNESEAMVQEMLRTGENLKPICRIVALAALNSRMKTKLLTGWLTSVLSWRVKNLSDLFAYLSLVYRQMGAQHFFFIMAYTKGMNFLEKRTKNQEKIAEVKPSGGQ